MQAAEGACSECHAVSRCGEGLQLRVVNWAGAWGSCADLLTMQVVEIQMEMATLNCALTKNNVPARANDTCIIVLR